MKKKLTSFALALAMCLTLTLPAFATQTGKLTSSLESMLPELAMTMPDSATIILNPYRMATSAEGTGIDSGDRFQIMNQVFSVVSATKAKVHVSATVTGVAKNATFVDAPVAPGDKNKNVYLTLTYAISHNETANIPAPDATSSNVLVVKDSEQTLEWDLPAAAKKTSSATTDTPQRIDMQFGGSCSDSPSESPWTSKDTVSCSFVFTVNPVTDIPMIALTYQSAASSAADLTFNVPKPADVNSTNPTYTLSEVKFGASSAAAAAATATALTDTRDKWAAGTATTDPTTVTLSGATFCVSGQPLFNATTTPTTQYALVTLTYKDNSTTPVVKTLQYELKVTVVGHGST